MSVNAIVFKHHIYIIIKIIYPLVDDGILLGSKPDNEKLKTVELEYV